MLIGDLGTTIRFDYLIGCLRGVSFLHLHGTKAAEEAAAGGSLDLFGFGSCEFWRDIRDGKLRIIFNFYATPSPPQWRTF
jgi:hypothetical protein